MIFSTVIFGNIEGVSPKNTTRKNGRTMRLENKGGRNKKYHQKLKKNAENLPNTASLLFLGGWSHFFAAIGGPSEYHRPV